MAKGTGNAPGPDYDDVDDDDDKPRKKRRKTEAPAERKQYTRKVEEEMRQLQSPGSPEQLIPHAPRSSQTRRADWDRRHISSEDIREGDSQLACFAL